jgi:hypothetical protein
MAHLVKPWIVSYHLPDGRKVNKGTPAAHKKRERARKWYSQYRDADGILRRVPLRTPDNG